MEKDKDKFKARELVSNQGDQLLHFMINVVKFNAALFSLTDQPSHSNRSALAVMIDFVYCLSKDVPASSHIDDLYELIYDFLNVVLSYSSLPPDSLDKFIVILCKGVDKQNSSKCDQIMKNLLGTHRGFRSLHSLLHIVEDETNYAENHQLLVGAIYFLSHSLWGELAHKAKNSSVSTNTVLPIFKRLLQNRFTSTADILLGVGQAIEKILKLMIPSGLTDEAKEVSSLKATPSLPDSMLEQANEIMYEYTWEVILDLCALVLYHHNNDSSCRESAQLEQLVKFIVQFFLDNILNDKYAQWNDQVLKHEQDKSIVMLLINHHFMEKMFRIIESGLQVRFVLFSFYLYIFKCSRFYQIIPFLCCFVINYSSLV